MTDQEKMLDTREAADYLGMSIRGFREHLYNQGDVHKDDQERGKNLYSISTLERFRAVRKPRGRPKTKGSDGGETSAATSAR